MVQVILCKVTTVQWLYSWCFDSCKLCSSSQHQPHEKKTNVSIQSSLTLMRTCAYVWLSRNESPLFRIGHTDSWRKSRSGFCEALSLDLLVFIGVKQNKAAGKTTSRLHLPTKQVREMRKQKIETKDWLLWQMQCVFVCVLAFVGNRVWLTHFESQCRYV